jgi:hypothetical protein
MPEEKNLYIKSPEELELDFETNAHRIFFSNEIKESPDSCKSFEKSYDSANKNSVFSETYGSSDYLKFSNNEV